MVGRPVLPPGEAALLYYLALLRLGSLAGFADVLGALVQAATTYYAGDPEKRDVVVARITAAYAEVGIHPDEAAAPAVPSGAISSPGGAP